MSNQRLDLAREWTRLAVAHETSEVSRAAAEVIQSLPDQWIDAERVREQVKKIRQEADSAVTPGELAHAYLRFAEAIESLLAPSLPTLADMTPEERQACLRAQAKTWYEVGILVWADEASEIAQLITRANGVLDRKFKDVTPLPDLPKLEWPGSHADTITAESVEDMQSGRVADFEPALPRPEDVPAGEPWIVRCEGENGVEGIGCRNEPGAQFPWLVIRMDGHQFDYCRYCRDSDVTLISRLVPEVAP